LAFSQDPKHPEFQHELRFQVRTKQYNGEPLNSLLGYGRLRLDPEIGDIQTNTGDEVHPLTVLERKRGRSTLKPSIYHLPQNKPTQFWRRKTGLNKAKPR
jgi:hypothetical protein